MSALPRSRDVHNVTGSFCLELFCGLASLTLSLVFEAVPCMCPWDSSFGSEFDVLLHGKVLFALAVAGRLAYAHFGLPCQSLTWARSPPLRSWDHVWGLSTLKGQAAEKALVGNMLLVFSVQLCFVLHAKRHYFSIENPLDSWTWAVAAVARLHAMPGVATVQVYYDQFGHVTPSLPFSSTPSPCCTSCRCLRARTQTKWSSCEVSAGTRESGGSRTR